jgi:signal transduction histidine kinase/ActR/RegA family two-component response regulator
MRIAAAVLALGLLAPGSAEAQTAGPRRILVVNSYHKGFAWTDAQTAGAREVLTSAFDHPELYVEYLDTKRIAYEGQYLDMIKQTFRLKYKGVKLDAIITTDDNALRLVMSLHAEVFDSVPVAFCGINDYRPSLLAGRDQFTGLVEVLDIKPTIDLALQLHPGTRKIVVIVDDTPTGMGQRRDVAAIATQYKQLHFEYLKGEDLTHAELLAKLGKLDSGSIVLLTVWLRDKTGAFQAPETEGPRISESSAVPVYGIIDMYMGHGIVGGKVLNSRTHGRNAAEMVVRILGGEKPADIPVLIESVNPYMFDARQFQRWSINEALLPQGSTILHRPFSFYQEYKALIWQVIIAFATLAAGLLVLLANIIRRKRAEGALRESEMMNSSLLDGSPVCNKIIDLDSKLQYMSAAGARDLKVPDIESYYGQTYPPEFYPESMRAPLVNGVELAKKGEVSSVECPVHDLEGNEVWYHSTFVPICDDNGQVKYIIGASVNITERKRAEVERLNLERQVQHAQKLESLGILAGGIAHDFNNLLMAILGNADLAMDELSPHAPARDNIKEIEKAAKRAAELSRQMLAYSGKGRFVVEPVDLNEFVEEMAHLLEVSISKKAVLKYNFSNNLPSIDCDATQIRQIIMNLITNASEAIGDKSGVIAMSTGAMECDRAYLDGVDEIMRAGLNEPLPEGLYVYLEVADTGCGMDAETTQKVFDPFFTTKFTGRGLGMAAVLGIVRGHRGAIKIYSEVAKGTTFKVLFPASGLPANSDALKRRDIDRSEEWQGRGTVLIADDEETIRAVGKQMLGRMGFDVLTAGDGREAIELFQDRTDDIVCILLDLTMPHVDGEQAFRELRRIRPDVIVILCSGYNEQDATQRFAGKGLAGFIQKPYNMAELRGKLMEVLPDGGQAESAAED